MGHYTNNGKRKSSMTHAGRSWECPCGRVVWGNGGRASHERACLTAIEANIAVHEGVADHMERSGTSVGREAAERHRTMASEWRDRLTAKRSA